MRWRLTLLFSTSTQVSYHPSEVDAHADGLRTLQDWSRRCRGYEVDKEVK